MTYGFMRTGLVGDVGDVAAEEFVGRAARLLKIMGDQAWHLALAYVAHHAWRTAVTPDDARMAIRYQARHFLENMDRGIDPLVTDEDDDDDLGDDIVVDFEEEDIDVEVGDIDDFPETETETTPTCPCAMCVAMHRATAEWASWDPADPVERFLKDSVDAFENK
jgi:hypothetical protein